MKMTINKKRIIALIILIASTLIIAFLNLRIQYNLDLFYMWHVSRCVATRGQCLYKDINIIVTPLSVYLECIPALISNSYIFWDICIMLPLFIAVAFISFKIFRHFSIDYIWSAVFTGIILFMFPGITINVYNGYTMLITYIVLYLFLSRKNKPDIKFSIILGLLCFISFDLKQTNGLFLSLGCMMCGYILCKKTCKKEEVHKKYIKMLLGAIGIFLIGTLIQLLIIYSLGELPSFIDQMTGIKYFKSDIKTRTIVLCIAGIEILCYGIINKKYKVHNEIQYIEILSILVMFRPFGYLDMSHFEHAFSLFIVTLLIIVDKKLVTENKGRLKVGFIEIASILSIVFVFWDSLIFNTPIDAILHPETGNYAFASRYAEAINSYIDKHDGTYAVIDYGYGNFANEIVNRKYVKYNDIILLGNTGTTKQIDVINNLNEDYIIMLDKNNYYLPQISNETYNLIESFNLKDSIDIGPYNNDPQVYYRYIHVNVYENPNKNN